MKWQNLKAETIELIANSIGIYYILKQRDKLYREENLASLSLYGGILRMGQIMPIKGKIQIGGTGPGTGYPYPNGIRYETREKPRYETRSHDYNNVVCQILNGYGITIEKTVEILDLDEKLLYPVSAIENTKLETQYNTAYQSLLLTIRNYYIASVRITENADKTYCPKIDMTIPNIISAIHYPNIDPYCSVLALHRTLEIESDSTARSLEEIEKHSTYQEGMCRYDRKTGELKDIYQVEKPLVMNKTLGRVC